VAYLTTPDDGMVFFRYFLIPIQRVGICQILKHAQSVRILWFLLIRNSLLRYNTGLGRVLSVVRMGLYCTGDRIMVERYCQLEIYCWNRFDYETRRGRESIAALPCLKQILLLYTTGFRRARSVLPSL